MMKIQFSQAKFNQIQLPRNRLANVSLVWKIILSRREQTDDTSNVSSACVCCTASLCRQDIYGVRLFVFAMTGQRSLNRVNPPCAALTPWSKVSLRNTGLTWPSNGTPETGSDGAMAKEPKGSEWWDKIKILATEEQSNTEPSQERSSATWILIASDLASQDNQLCVWLIKTQTGIQIVSLTPIV